MSGLLVTFEGGEACGKSTQVALLAERLRGAGREVVTVHEPGSTPIGELIRGLLLHAREASGLDPRTEVLLFNASRAQLVSQIIQPALERGAVVLSDRFVDSTLVYQGFAQNMDLRFLHQLNAFVCADIKIHRTYLFDLDLDVAQARRLRRVRPVEADDRIEAKPREFHERVRQGYLELARTDPERILVLDAARPAKELAEIIWEDLRGAVR
jgi:dTMP kinase